MWLLKDSNGKINYLFPNKIINIGRKQADIILENDSSISRSHATISVILKDQMKLSELSSTCIIKDVKSKYGSTIIRNSKKIKVTDNGIEIQPLDKIQFGLQGHIFQVEYIPFITVTSRLSNNDKLKLKDVMDKIGGLILESYNEKCTHLTATTATSTNKIISALVACLPIVNIDYWQATLKALESSAKLPDPVLFTLKLQDKGINNERASLKPNPIRKTLFNGKKFIFFAQKAYDQYKRIIKDAGGNIELYKETSNIPEYFCAENNLVMQLTNEGITEDLITFNNLLYEKLKKERLRMINEDEIPLAVVYANLEQYCNPRYTFKGLIKRRALKEDKSKVLAVDTQDILSSDFNIPKPVNSRITFIPETITFSQADTLDKNNLNHTEEEIETVPSDSKVEKLSTSRNNAVIPKIVKTSQENVPLIKQSLNQAVENKINDINKPSISKISRPLIAETESESYESMEIPLNTNEICTSELKLLEDDKNDSEIKANVHVGKSVQSTKLLLKEPKSISNKHDNIGKKRPRESSANESKKSNWISFDNSKKRKIETENRDVFAQFEKLKTKTKEEAPNNFRAKKLGKEYLDFDLDDLDSYVTTKANEGLAKNSLKTNNHITFKENVKDNTGNSSCNAKENKDLENETDVSSSSNVKLRRKTGINFKHFKKQKIIIPKNRTKV